jgi:hypothetical protein
MARTWLIALGAMFLLAVPADAKDWQGRDAAEPQGLPEYGFKEE